jgi:hypothetical protein
MQFPKRFPWLIVAILMLTGLPVLPVAAWFWLVTPPLQNYYLIPYLDSTERGSQPDATTKVEWLLKTAPGRKPEVALGADVVSASRAITSLNSQCLIHFCPCRVLVSNPLSGSKKTTESSKSLGVKSAQYSRRLAALPMKLPGENTRTSNLLRGSTAPKEHTRVRLRGSVFNDATNARMKSRHGNR